MILATSKMVVRPEKRADLLQTMLEMLEPVRVEKGCIGFRLCEDVENSNVFLLLEEWETQKDIERHLSREHQKRLLTLMDNLSEAPEIWYYHVTKTMGVELIEKVLGTPDSE